MHLKGEMSSEEVTKWTVNDIFAALNFSATTFVVLKNVVKNRPLILVRNIIDCRVWRAY